LSLDVFEILICQLSDNQETAEMRKEVFMSNGVLTIPAVLSVSFRYHFDGRLLRLDASSNME
jgi:hypothetical protein